VQFIGGSPNVDVRYLPLMLSGTARQWINDLAENSIQTWLSTNPPSWRSSIVWKEASYSAIACYENGMKEN
jgi:hypothetical protein